MALILIPAILISVRAAYLEFCENAMHDFNNQYKYFENGSMEIFIDKAVNPELETEIFVNANMTHYLLRDYSGMWNMMAEVVRDYEKIGKRNKKKDDLHLNKHAMHLIQTSKRNYTMLRRIPICRKPLICPRFKIW